MNNSRGKLIVIEGIDGSGKTTQYRRLVEKLESQARMVKNIHFPRHETPFFGMMVDEYLNGRFGDPATLDPRISSLLYACDRWEAKDQMYSWLKEDAIIVLDRYMTSNKGHQLGKIAGEKEKLAYLKWLDELEFEIFKIPVPDRVIYLDMPLDKVQELMRKRDQSDRTYTKGHDLLESNLRHLRDAQEAYRFTARLYPYWKQIDCCEEGKLLSIEQIQEKIWREVQSIL